MRFRVIISETCLGQIARLPDKRTQGIILRRIDRLSEDPESKGKALVKQLAGFRSLRVAGRYRVLFKVDDRSVTVYVLAMGIRKEGDRRDIYRVARKILDAGLLSLNPTNE